MTLKTISIIIITTLFFSCSDDDQMEEQKQENFNFDIETSGYFIDSNQLKQELDKEVYDTLSSFKKTILREFNSTDEENFINIAESIYPSRDSIFDLGNFEPNELDEIDGNLWWYSQFDGIKIPFATTRSANKYYCDLIDFYKAGDFESAMTITNSEAEFIYRATVNFENEFVIDLKEFKNVYVVNLELNWFSFCGSLCALWVDSKRTVIIDTNNNKIYIFGDGPISVVVS